jgi:hypothetical protein
MWSQGICRGDKEIRYLNGSEKGQLFLKPLQVFLFTVMECFPPLYQGADDSSPYLPKHMQFCFFTFRWQTSLTSPMKSKWTRVIGKDFAIPELDAMLPTEAMLCHYQLICLFSTEVSVVFFHSGLNCWTSLLNTDLTRGCCRRHVSVRCGPSSIKGSCSWSHKCKAKQYKQHV